ncbi:MAG: T9SS type A sorting domain-containing protein [Bacteroidetes bacterium]|nr:T9SS type A sorting domain-containing protein [Bacteroidota bacterium]MBL0019993.1 T9SS type A sorting domain-containing protein [Bacteroidota bacterium]
MNCYPNPTDGALPLAYILPMEMDVTLRMYNSASAEMNASAQGTQGADGHAAQLDMAQFAAGIYLVKFVLGPDVVFRKVFVE